MKNLFLPITLALTSCAALGTKSNLTTLVQPNSFQRIAVVITSQATAQSEFNQRVDSLFVKELTIQLAALPSAKIKFIGDVERVLKQPDLQQKTSGYDAILHAEISLSYNGALAHDNGYNSWVRMQGFKLPEKQLLGDSYFNTQSGKIYTTRPTLEQSVHDGVEGVLKPWLKQLVPTK